jgi:hypothetical protein
MVTDETNKYVAFSQRKCGICNSNWKHTIADGIEEYTGVLIYMETVYLLTLGYYFYGDICVCTTVRQVMTLK